MEPWQEHLRLVSAQLALVREAGRLGLFERNLRTGAGRWDPQVIALFGMDPAHGTPSFAEAVENAHPADREGLRAYYAQAIRQVGRHAYRFRVVHRGGRVCHLHALVEVQPGADAEPERMIGVLIDDTEHVERLAVEQASTALLDKALDLAGVSVWRIDLERRRISFNERGARILGRLPGHDEMPLAEMRALAHPDDRDAVVRAAEAAVAGDEVVDVVVRYRHADGGYRNLLTRRVAERDQNGRSVALAGVSLDMTEWAAERERAREAAARLELVAQAAGVGIWSRDVDAGVVDWNEQMSRMFERDPAQKPPSRAEWLAEYLHPDDHAKYLAALPIEPKQQRDGPFHIEFRVALPTRGQRWIECWGRHETRDGRCISFGVCVDVTARRMAEEELRETRERAALAAGAAGIGAWDRDLAGQPVYWNEQMYRLRGLDPADPRPISELAALVNGPRDHAELDRLVRRHLDHGEPYEHEWCVRWPDGSEHWLATRGRVVRDAAGNALRMSGVNWDVTPRKLAEQAMRDKQVAEEASRAKSEFLARMSHELRTPMNAMLGFTQLVADDRDEPLTARQRERLAVVRTAGQHLLTLIDDVLDLAQVEVEPDASLREVVRLGDAVREAIEWIAPLASEHEVKVRASAEQGSVRAERRRVRQVLCNLLSNAVKYNRRGGEVEVACLERERSGQRQWGLLVRDTGNGMTQAQVEQLFQPFNRLGAEKGPIEGTGIGLTIVQQIVRRLGGQIEVDSRPGLGTSFCVWLPAAASATAGDGAEPAARVAAARPLQVLCIEDNPVNLLLVRELFALRESMLLSTATHGAEGIATALRERPDVVLLDMQLPDMHGLDVLRRLRAQPELGNTRFIALSANAMTEDVSAALAAGFDDYWTKPINFAAFLAGLDGIASSRV